MSLRRRYALGGPTGNLPILDQGVPADWRHVWYYPAQYWVHWYYPAQYWVHWNFTIRIIWVFCEFDASLGLPGEGPIAFSEQLTDAFHTIRQQLDEEAGRGDGGSTGVAASSSIGTPAIGHGVADNIIFHDAV